MTETRKCAKVVGMVTREQENTIERLSLTRDGESLAVRDGFEDGAVHVTLRTGRTFVMDRWGDLHEASGMGGNFSINWKQR